MHTRDIDLNLLRLFDAVYRAQSVSRAADELGLTQPAVSQGLGRLRRLLKDPLFSPTRTGVQPTAAAVRLAGPVRAALLTLDQALGERHVFDPAATTRTFRLHMSDIGEERFLPQLIRGLAEQAPQARLETRYLPPEEIATALDRGAIDLAFGFLPHLTTTGNAALLKDRYVAVVRGSNPLAGAVRRDPSAADLRKLQFVAVRTHADTFRILRLFHLEDRLKMVIDHFTALAGIVRASDLAAIMPKTIALAFAPREFAILDVFRSIPDYTVSLHWSEKFASDPGVCWIREFSLASFKDGWRTAPRESALPGSDQCSGSRSRSRVSRKSTK